MIAAATMPALPSAPPSGEATTSAASAESAAQDSQAAQDAAPATKSASRTSAKAPVEKDRGESDFDRLLEPDAATPALPNASAQPAAAPHDHAASAKDTPAATPGASLAEQLLGLLGALPGATPSAATPAAMPANAPAALTPPPTTTAAAAKPQVAGATLAAPTTAPPAPATPAPDAAKADGAFATLLSVASADGTSDMTAPIATDTPVIAGRDTPLPTLAPTPAPAGIDKLPAVPQPALVQPSDPRSGYGDELGSSVVWMAENRLGHAQLQVSPDHLGPIEVRLQIDGARVHAEFYSAQPDVRHALESSLPRLRDMLGQHGLQLGQADVGQRQRNDTPRAPVPGNDQSDCFPGDARPLPAAIRRARGLVDEYA